MVYDEHGEVASAVAAKFGSKFAKHLKLGEAQGVKEIAEKAISRSSQSIRTLSVNRVTLVFRRPIQYFDMQLRA